VDKNNTLHYDYSGLIYLSTEGIDFEGGALHFYDHQNLDCSKFVDDDDPGPCVAIGKSFEKKLLKLFRNKFINLFIINTTNIYVLISSYFSDVAVFHVCSIWCFILKKNKGKPKLIVKPRRGRMIMFGSGRENPHRVTKVKSGKRYVLSFWFTCDKRKRFKTFLDGKVHQTFNNNNNQEL
jgi:hypothetical protein